jgi:hypothetical protein
MPNFKNQYVRGEREKEPLHKIQKRNKINEKKVTCLTQQMKVNKKKSFIICTTFKGMFP